MKRKSSSRSTGPVSGQLPQETLSGRLTAPPPKPQETDNGDNTDTLRIIPLGGVGEIGKNCTIIQYGDDMLMVDGGLKFPEDDILGIDLIIPDLSYVYKRRANLRGILITHGHEDHIGALPYLLPGLTQTISETVLEMTAPDADDSIIVDAADLEDDPNERTPTAGRRLPIFGSQLALRLVQARMEERLGESGGLSTNRDVIEWHPVAGLEQIPLGPFVVEFVSVDHSIPDAFAVAVSTPAGRVLVTGDWKFAELPEKSRTRFKELGDEGLLALLPDTTRIESAGRTPPESVVTEELDRIIRDAKGRVIVTSFASNIHRVSGVIESAVKYGRVCALVGRSMDRNINIARELGYIDYPNGAVVPTDQINSLPPERVVILSTGAQGEPGAALSRIASGEHRSITIQPNDTVVLSATPVPGNERSVGRTIDNLFRAGAHVIYNKLDPLVHVSGHAAYDEHAELLDMTRPRYLIPVHGEVKMQVRARDLGLEKGMPLENIFIMEVGEVVELSAERGKKRSKVESGSMLVDGVTVGAVTQVVLRDRRQLAGDGIVIASAVLDRESGKLVSDVTVMARGLPYASEGTLIEESQTRATKALNRRKEGDRDTRLLGDIIKQSIGAFIFNKTGLRPMIIPVLTEI